MSIPQDRLARAMIVRRGLAKPVYLKTVAPGAVSARGCPLIVQWSFLLFIFSIACDVWSSAKLSGFLLFAVYVLYHNPVARRRRPFAPFPGIIIWFVIYFGFYAVNGLFLPTERLGEFFTRLFTLVQSLIFLWIASDILKDEKMAKKALLAYSCSAVIAALGLLFQLPGFDVSGDAEIERTSAYGVEPYSVALAVVMLLGLWLNLGHKRIVESVWMFASIFVISVAIVAMGTRGSFVMLLAGVSVYLVPFWKNWWRISTLIIVVIAIAGLAYIAATNPVFSDRWLAYTEEGDTSGRDIIFAHALDMISERPLLGWQPIEFRYELGTRVGARKDRDAHNTYLHLFMEVGIVGAVPFLIGLWLCGKEAWRARNLNLGLLPLALLVALLAGSMAGTTMYLKPQWFVLAVAVAAARERHRRGMILLYRRTRSWKSDSCPAGVVSNLKHQQRSALDPEPTAKD